MERTRARVQQSLGKLRGTALLTTRTTSAVRVHRQAQQADFDEAHARICAHQPPSCHLVIHSTGWIRLRVFSARLSRINARSASSVPMSRSTLTHGGTRAAIKKPAIIDMMSPTELMMLSPL